MPKIFRYKAEIDLTKLKGFPSDAGSIVLREYSPSKLSTLINKILEINNFISPSVVANAVHRPHLVNKKRYTSIKINRVQLVPDPRESSGFGEVKVMEEVQL